MSFSSRFSFYLFSALLVDAVLLLAAVPILMLTGSFRMDLSLILLFVMMYKSLMYALAVSVQSRWQPQPEVALRFLGMMISRWAGLLTGLFVGAMLGSWPWVLLGGLGFYFIGRRAGSLIGLQAGKYLERHTPLAQPVPDFPALSARWLAVIRYGPFLLPPLMLLVVGLAGGIIPHITGVPRVWIRIVALIYIVVCLGVPWTLKSRLLANYQDRKPPLGLSPEMGVYLFGSALINVPAILGLVSLIFEAGIWEVTLLELIAFVGLVAWYRAWFERQQRVPRG